jgi:hypothetical protein
MTLTGSFDVVSTYMFRGIRQHSTGIALWPAADLGLAVYSGTGALKSVSVNTATWNSLHTGDTGLDGLSGKFWYESDFYAALGFGLPGATTLTTTYTAYTSPNNSYTTVKEIAFKLAVDDSAYLHKAAGTSALPASSPCRLVERLASARGTCMAAWSIRRSATPRSSSTVAIRHERSGPSGLDSRTRSVSC